MNFLTRHSLVVATVLTLGTQSVWAHDPAEHAKEAAAAKASAKCDNLQKMDMSKMDPKDPVMQAMMQKCANKPAATTPGSMPAMDHSAMKDMPMKMDHGSMAMPTTPAPGK